MWERAEEAYFVHSNDMRFVARRAGLAALATWAGEGMGWDNAQTAGYVEMIVASFLAGKSADEIVMRVRSDLERSGKPALSTVADDILAQAEAEARQRTSTI